MLLLLLVFTPLVAIPAVYFGAMRLGAKIGYISALAPLLGLVTVLACYPTLLSGEAVAFEAAWVNYPGINISFNLSLDGLSLLYAFAITSVSLSVCVYSVKYMAHRIAEMGLDGHASRRAYSRFYALFISFYLGMIGTVVSTNVIQFYIFYETILISTWLLIHMFGYGEREKIALTYFIWTHLSGLLILLGFAVHFMDTGLLDIASYQAAATAPYLLLAGFSIKMAVFGMHTWLPLAHGEAPTPISALLSPITIGIGAYGILRLASPAVEALSPLLMLWAMVTILYGGLVALHEDDIKRLLAYSSISHMGYMLLGIASLTTVGMVGVSYHYLSHAFLKAILFMTAGVLMMQLNGTRSISKMGGLASKTPLAALFLASGFLGLAGFPPFSGFNSKLIIFTGAFLGGSDSNAIWLVVGAAFFSFLTLAYGINALRKIMFGPPKDGLELKHPEKTMVLAMAILLLLAIIFFLAPWLVIIPMEV
jgi:NADH-quinone oxidoreductase subunit M